MGHILQQHQIDEEEYVRISVQMLLKRVLGILSGESEACDIPFLNLYRQIQKFHLKVWHDTEKCVKDGIQKAISSCFETDAKDEQVSEMLKSLSWKLYDKDGDISSFDPEQIEFFKKFLKIWLEALQEPFALVQQ